MIEEDINERIARLAPSQNIAERQLKPAAIDAIAALPQAPTAQLAAMEQDQYGLNAAQDVLIKSLPSANDTAMKSSLMAARTVSPDQAARARKAATQAGVGTDIALRNFDEIERRAYMRDIDRMEIARRDPALAEFLRDRDNAMLAQDDIANLRETKSLYDTIIEYPRELMRDATIGVAAGMMDFRASMYAYDLRDRDAISETERSQMLGMFSLSEAIYNTRQPGFVTSAARVAGQQVEPMQQAVGRGAQTGLVFGGAAAVGGQIGPQAMLPEELVTVPGAMTFGFSAGMTSSLVETSFKQLAGYSYAEMMRENIPQRQAYWVSGVAGSINAGLELGGLALVTRPFRQVIAKAIARKVADELAQATTKQIATTAAKEYLIGGAGEVAVEVTQEVVDAVAVSAAQYIDQYGLPSSKRNVKLMTAQGWEELVDKSVKVGIETAKAMAILGVAGPFVKGTYTVVQMDKARKQAKFMEQAIELASLSKLRERDPVAYRNLLEQRAQATPAENVYIDANIMDGILRKQGITAADMDAVIPDFSARLGEAQASNASVRLSSAEFVAQLSQSEVGRAMAQHLRVGDPNAMSMFDVAQGEAMRQAMLEQSRAAMEARTEADRTFVDSANRVEDSITEMLRETGKLTPDQVTATAEVMSAFVVVQAAEAKQTPEEFWARWRNQIVGPQAAPAMAGMEQAAQFDLTGQRRLDTPQFKQWFRESKAVDRKGMPLMLYHGTEAAEDFAVFEPGGGFFARGIYLSPRPKVAGEYAGTGTGARIMPLYASIQNPFVVDSDTTFEQAVSRETGVAVTEETSPDTITELLRSKGYDGVYVRADDVWVAFDPQQVKSVNNRGTWTGEAMLEQQQIASLDAAHAAAEKAGDVATGERLTKQAAMAAGLTETVYRGDQQPGITEYAPERRTEPGIFTTYTRNVAEEFYAGEEGARKFYVGGRTLDLSWESRETVNWIREWARESGFDFIDRASGEAIDPVEAVMSGRMFDFEGDWSGARWKDIQRTAKAQGYDIVKLRDSGDDIITSVVVLNENNIKLADPFTYDAQGNLIPLSRRFNLQSRSVLEQQPISPTAALESVANVEAAFAFAGTQTFKTNRQFKEALQARVAEAAARNGVDLSAITPEVDEYLVRVAVADAITALQTNPNAVGWYNEKVTKALRLVSLIHPEIATDPRAKFAFTWALAVTSNGLKVKKNFELAERVYSQYKATGRMPTNVQAGQAQIAINESLALFNDLVDKYGIDNVERFMTSKTTVKRVIEYTGKNVSGENLTTEVYGAAALGPKIGNGFFANLYGHFEQLTMDRWLMRTWGRWTASLLDDNTQNIATKRSQLTAIVKAMGAKARRDLSAIVGIDVGAADPDALATAVNKASMSKANRLAMAEVGIADDKAQAKLSKILGNPVRGTVRVSFGDEFRKVGNALAKYLDGQKEAPSGPPERARIRGVMSRALSQLQAQYPSLTMSDLQALLWYPEKRLYDAAKTSDEGKTGYEDNEAPDYANAAADLAAEMGVAQDLIQATIKDVDEELKAIADERAATAQRGAGDGLLRQAPVAQAGVYEQAQVSPEFYSALERGIDAVDAKELTGAQWKERVAALVNKGIVKQAEVEWSFLNEWLSLPRDGKISKAQVKDYLKNNGIRVNVITYGGGDPTLAGVRLAEQALERAGALNDDAISAIERIRTAKPEGQLYRQSWELLDELLGAAGIKQSLMDFVDESAPHFDEYVEADGRNYREELLQLPDTAAQTQRLELRNRLYREYGYLVRTRIEDYPQDNPLVQELKQIESTMTKRDLARFTMGHYDEPNVLVHIRRDDRTDAAGMLTMNVGELQSDWAQKGRELGFAKTEQEQDLAFWKGEVSRLTAQRDEFESGDDARRRIGTAIDAVNELYADMQRTYSADKLEQMTDWRDDEGQLKFEPDEGLTFEEIRDVLGGLMMDLSNAGYAEEADRMDDIADTMLEGSGFSELMTQLDAATQSVQVIERTGSTIMPAPFVTSTSGWVDLALKHLMMEAVKGGYGRIIFPTWQVQMMRYGSDRFSWYRMPDGTYRVASDLAWDQDAIADIDLAEAGKRAMAAKGSRVSKAEDLKKIIEPRNPQMTAKQLDSLANKMWERMQASDGVGAMLPRREGMEAFYGDENMIDPKTGKLSIVGAALAKLSKKYKGPSISATEISIEEPSEGVTVVVTSPEQAERVMDWMEANVPDIDNVMDYDEERMAVEVDEMTERQRRRLETSFAGEPDSPEITWVANPVGIDERHTRSGIEITPELAAAIGTGLPLFQDARGTFDPETFVTRLGQAGDISTVAHETAHYWLEVMGRIAGDSGAPARIVEDLDRVLQWFGIAGASPVERIAKWNSMSLEEKRKHHEAFALNFELYLFEGKAPSIELQGVFDKFKRWLMVVYKQIRDQLNVQYKQQFGRDLPVMTGEVRQVMDRLLATDEQIKRAQAMRDMMGDFETQEQSGLNDAEWEAYQSLRNEATDEAAREHAKASLRQMQWLSNAKSKMLKDMQARHKKMRDRVREEVSNAVRRERVYRAIDFLRRGRWINEEGNEETTTTHKLDAAAVQRMYELEPENLRPDLAKLGKGKYGILAKEGGMDPELAAEALGYASADEMIRAVIDARPIAEVIDERTDARMLAESGELATPQSREEAIDRALHNEARGRFIAVELRLHSKATQPANSMRQAARQVAKQVISGRRIRDIRPREYVAAESRAARDAASALRDLPNPKVAGQAAFTRSMTEQASAIAAGMPISDAQAIAEAARQDATRKAQERVDAYREKYPDADPAQVVIAAKRNQLLNNQMAAEAIAVRDEIETALEKFRRLFRPDEKIAKGRDMNLVNAGRAVLAYYGLGRSDKSPAEYLEQMRSYDPELYEELRPLIERAARGPQNYRDLTVDEFRIMRDAVEAFWYGSRRRNQIKVEGKLVDLETATSALVERLEEIGVPEVVPGERRAPTAKDRAVRALNTLKAIMTRVEHWAWRTDGPGDVRAFTTYIWRPVKDALIAYRLDRNTYVKRFVDLLGTITIPEGKIDAQELNYTFGYGNGGLGKAEVLGAMMHMGNESNLRKLLLGRGWGELDADGNLVTARWDAFVTRMFAEGVVTKADMDFLQAVWDLNEEIKPLAQKAHYELFGYYFQEVGASPIVTPFGEYRGGYVPAKTDSFMVADARSNEAMEELESDFRQSMPSTGRGFTRSRTEYNRPLSLDLRLMARHIDSVVRFAHVQPAIRDVLRILRVPAFRDALNRADPGAINDMLLPWLTRAARQVTMEPGMFKLTDKFWTAVRSRIGSSIMFANLRNALQQLTGAFPAMLRVDPGYFKSALATYIGSPFKVADEVASMSPFMANRMRSQMFELQESMNDILLNPSKYEKIQQWSNKHGYFLQTAHQNIVDIVTWTGAYNQSLAQSGLQASDPVAQREAIAAGDAAVRMTQGSMDPEDVSRVEVGSPFYRTFVQFTGYFNMLANLNSSEYIRVIRDLGWRSNKGRLVYIYVMGFMLPTIVADAIVRTLGGQWDDEDEDGYLDVMMSWFFGSQIRAGAAMIPFGGVGLQLATGGFTSAPYDDRISASPSLAALERATVGTTKAVIALIDPDKDVSGKNVRDVLTLLSLFSGIPAEVIGRPVGYALDVQRGDVEPTGMWDYIRGLVTGAASPESKR